MSKFKYRSHRGMLTDSMLTAREYESKQELLDYLQKLIIEVEESKLDERFCNLHPYEIVPGKYVKISITEWIGKKKLQSLLRLN